MQVVSVCRRRFPRNGFGGPGMFIQGILLLVLSISLAAAKPHREGCGKSSSLTTHDNVTCPATAPPKRLEEVELKISKWIWTGENAVPRDNNPPGARAFRKIFTSSCGKCAVSANIVIAADNQYRLFINGQLIGSGSNYAIADAYHTALQPSSNLFAVEATNMGGPSGLTATFLINYSDGSSETIITDETWRTFVGTPRNFQLPTVDHSKWGFATFQGMNGIAPWGRTVVPPSIAMQNASFIWTGTINNGTGVAPMGSRAFRKTVVSPGCTKRAVSAIMLLNVDDLHTLYVNGHKIDSGVHWWETRAYHIPNPTLNHDVNVFAINATNLSGPASLIAAIHIAYDDGTSDTVLSDETWKASESVSAGFELSTLDDSKWAAATNLGRFGRKPWAGIRVPKA